MARASAVAKRGSGEHGTGVGRGDGVEGPSERQPWAVGGGELGRDTMREDPREVESSDF